MANFQINMIKGDTMTFALEFDRATEIDSAFFSVKKNATDEGYVFQKTLNDGIYRASENTYVVRVAPDDTSEIEAGNYNFDLEIIINGDVFTLMLGVLVIEQDVTWEVES